MHDLATSHAASATVLARLTVSIDGRGVQPRVFDSNGRSVQPAPVFQSVSCRVVAIEPENPNASS
jgi:hypothetical protein